MMAPGLVPVAAVVAVAAGTPDVRPASTTAGGDQKRSQRDLYAPSPVAADSGIAAGFYRAYGRSMTSLELTHGARLGPLVGRPPAPTITEARAGIGVGTRRIALGLVALLMLVLALAASLIAAPAARAELPDQFLGITTEDAYTGKDAYSQRQLKAQRAAGFTVARQVFRWDEVEWGDDRFDFSATDRFVKNAAISGMRVMPLLQGEPKWPTSRPKGNTSRYLFPPKSPATYAGYASAIAQRYGPGGLFWAANPQLSPMPVTSYQLWNEPNFPVYWGGKPNARQYARLVIAAAEAIRAVDPNAYIVSAGLPDSRLGQKPSTFVRTMLNAGAGDALDAIGIHPYAKTPAKTLAIARQLRRTIDRAGGDQLDLWVTEIGWAAGGPRAPERTVSAAKQGPTIVSAIQRLAAARESLRLRGIVYFAWRDGAVYKGGKDFWGLHTGLLDRRGKPKPALKTVTSALSSLQ
jgi:polysaccharide biosynthesis protein PslG